MGIESKTHLVSDVNTFVFRQFGDDANVQITIADVIRFVNLGSRQIFETDPSMNMVNSTADIVANQAVYNLPSLGFTNIRFIRSIRYQGQVLLGFTRKEAEMYLLYNNVLYPAPPAGIPTNWWLDDSGQLYLYPTPMTPVSGGLLIHYNAYPNTVTQPTDTVDIPDSHYNALLSFVMSKIYELDENWPAAAAQKKDYDAFLSLAKDRTEVDEDNYPVILLDPEDSVY